MSGVFNGGFYLAQAAVVEIGKIIGFISNGRESYMPKNTYVTTPDREMLLRQIYDKSYASLENQLNLRTDIHLSESGLLKDLEQTARLKTIHTVSMFESISQVEPMLYVAQNKHGDAWNKVSSLVSRLKEEMKASRYDLNALVKSADIAESLLREVSRDSHALLAKAEQELTLNALCESMSSLSYKVKSDSSSLVASKGATVVRANFANGMVSMDARSFPGISCHGEVQKIEKELEKRGILVRRLADSHTRLRMDNVELRDPFPASPGKNKDAQRSKQPAEKQEGAPTPFKLKNSPASLLVQMQQRNLNMLKE